ncbi:MAG: metallophosphoesterase [Cyclobacteriaceae bacterium]|nr:metallophosphoesterase [Cyclobacteriaceae bacterium]MCH8515679.1 metallophosphoesterase [Cyclobacteriaceae bacterium]
MDNNNKGRRNFLKASIFSGLGMSLSPTILAQPLISSASDFDFSFVHLTDMHVRRKRKGHEGYKKCVSRVNSLENRPDFVLMGGDCAFDGMYTPKEEYLDQLDLFKEISDQLEMPYYNCLGNHDTFGLSSRRKTDVDDPDIGKVLFKKKLNLDNTYYSFDHGDWHFVVMDSLLQVDTELGPSQTHAFGEEQLEWLRKDLGQNSGRPTVIVTHIAAFCNIGQYNADPELKAMNHMVVKDTLEFRRIIERHRVKVVLQGHSHIPEDYCFNGVWYITSQSVSAAWWGGNWKGYLPGFTQLMVKGEQIWWERKDYEWQHFLEPEDTLEKQRIEERRAFEGKQKRLRQEDTKLR